jgi:hypothetical protein
MTPYRGPGMTQQERQKRSWNSNRCDEYVIYTKVYILHIHDLCKICRYVNKNDTHLAIYPF